MREPIDGILNVHKEQGFTSHDVVAKLRGILKQKKIGHTGTLDPDATGVLPVCLGRATKVCEYLTDRSKMYTARVRLGVVTDTQDLTGQVLEEHAVRVTREELEKAVSAFTGEIWQTPPMYSAVKVNGKRLYELARQGVEVERKKRRITVYSCAVSDFTEEDQTFTMEVHCSKGTYIRTLCHDIGERLGCGAAMASLVRTQSGMFSLEGALTLAQIEQKVQEGTLEEAILPIDAIFEEYPAVVVSQQGLRFLQNGNALKQEWCGETAGLEHGETVRMYDPDRSFYALYRYDGKKRLYTNVKMFYNAAGQS